MSLTVSQFVIKNWMGLERCHIGLGSITRIAGANESGKSSAIKAIQSMLEGGRNTRQIRNGQDAANITLKLSNGYEFTQTDTENGVTFRGKDADGKPIPSARETLRKLLDAYAVNIARLVGATAPERLKLFLEAMLVEVAAEQLQEACGDVAQVGPADAQGHALTVIDKLYSRVEASRREINVGIRTRRGHVAQLEKALPPAETATAAEEYEQVRAARLEKQAEIKEQEREAASVLDSAKNEIDRDIEIRARKIREHIAELQADLSILDLEAAHRKMVAATKVTGDNQVAVANLQREHAELVSRESTLKAQAEEHARGEATRKVIAAENKELGADTARSEQHTAAMDRLTDLRNNLTKHLPISGLEIRDGEIYYRGVHFDDLNTATWVTLFVGLAALRAPNGGFIVLDGAECLDAEKLAGLENYCRKKNLQVIYAKVDEGPLRVEAE